MNYQSSLLIVLALSVSGAACKKEATPPPTPVQVVAPPAPASVPASPAASPATAAAPAAKTEKSEHDQQMALHFLNSALREYYANTGKFPATLDELYREPGLLKQRFTPPAGRQFILNPQTRAVEVR